MPNDFTHFMKSAVLVFFGILPYKYMITKEMNIANVKDAK